MEISKYYYKVTPLVFSGVDLIVDFNFRIHVGDDNSGYPCLGTFDLLEDAIFEGMKDIKKFFNNSVVVDHADALRLEVIDAKNNKEICNYVIFRGTPICDYCGATSFKYYNGRLACYNCKRSSVAGSIRAGVCR